MIICWKNGYIFYVCELIPVIIVDLMFWSYLFLNTLIFLVDLTSCGNLFQEFKTLLLKQFLLGSSFEFLGFRLSISADSLVMRSLVSATCWNNRDLPTSSRPWTIL